MVLAMTGCSKSSDAKIITFGKYAGEDIEWTVLKEEDGKALIITRYTIDAIPYNNDWVDSTWEMCSLRNWLNGEFIDASFSSEEQNRIESTHLVNDNNRSYGTNGGNDTEDKVFLLSLDEANELFASDSARQTSPTSYSESRGGQKHLNGMIYWWIRTPGCEGKSASFVHSAGYVNDRGRGVTDYSIGVRPAMWITIAQ